MIARSASEVPSEERAALFGEYHERRRLLLSVPGVLLLKQPSWYRDAGRKLYDARSEESAEARTVRERKQRKAQTKAARAARMTNARAGIRERLMRELEQASLLRTLMDEPPAAA